jgi:hypothetical protein
MHPIHCSYNRSHATVPLTALSCHVLLLAPCRAGRIQMCAILGVFCFVNMFVCCCPNFNTVHWSVKSMEHLFVVCSFKITYTSYICKYIGRQCTDNAPILYMYCAMCILFFNFVHRFQVNLLFS